MLAETDAFTACAFVDHPFKVRCDECGKEYVYKPSEVMRVEEQSPESFTTHPLFDERTDSTPAVTDKSRDGTRRPTLLSLAQSIISRTVARSRSLFEIARFSRHRRQ